MSKIHDKKQKDDLRQEYDMKELLNKGVRGKYAARYHSGTNLVLLDPDVAKDFTDDKSVNESLRLVIKLSKIKKGGQGRKKMKGK